MTGSVREVMLADAQRAFRYAPNQGYASSGGNGDGPTLELTEDQKRDMRIWCAHPRVMLPYDHTVTTLFNNYGPLAYDLMKKAMREPDSVMDNIGQERNGSSKATIQYIMHHQLSAAQIAGVLGKTEAEVMQALPSGRQQAFDDVVARRQAMERAIRERLQANTGQAQGQEQTQEHDNPQIPTQTQTQDVTPVSDEPQAAPQVHGSMTFEQLATQYGVNAADLQAVFERDPEIAHSIGGGATCDNTGRTISRQTWGRPEGGCLAGVQQKILPDSLGSRRPQEATDAYARYRRDVIPDELERAQGTSNGGCAAWYVLDATDKYVSVSMHNPAYGGNSSRNAEINDFVGRLKCGCVVSWDAIEDSAMRRARGNTPGGKWGHVSVIGPDGRGYSDGAQRTYNSARYGEYIHISFPKDANIPANYANMLIAEAERRRALEAERARQAQAAQGRQGGR